MMLRLLGLAVLLVLGGALQSQTPPETEPRFEIATIKLNPACKTGPMPPARQSPGRWTTECSTLQDLIRSAFLSFADGLAPNPRAIRTEIVGGPEWVRSDYYALQAKADGQPPLMRMLGPMTGLLIKERFHLKFHLEETRARVYELAVSRGGPRVTMSAEGECIQMDFNHPPAVTPKGQTPPTYCGERLKGNPQLTQLDYIGVSMTEFAGRLATRMDRDVIDRTGLSGRFDLHLEFTPDERTPGFGKGGLGLAPGLVGAFPARPPSPPPADVAPEPAGQSIFNAVERLGLKLEPADGTRQILVIDSVDRPTEN